MIFSSLCNYLTLCVSKDLTSCLTATPKTLLDTLQQCAGAPAALLGASLFHVGGVISHKTPNGIVLTYLPKLGEE